MREESLAAMSDGKVLARLVELLREERRLTAAVLAHLGEVEARQLYRPAACSSMHVYCTSVLGMSDDQAFKRIRAARAMREFPVVAAAIEEGRLHLTAVVRLAPHLTDENVEALVAEASGKSKAEIEVLLARLAPRPDVAGRLERMAEQMALVPEPPHAAATPPAPHGARSAEGTAKVAPLSPARFALAVTIGEATQQKLLRAQALLRHQLPSGDLAEVLDRALDALLEKVERRKFGKAKAPRAATMTRANGRYVPRAVRRQVVSRDGMQCSFVAEDGRRCEETGFLELDHVVPVSRGGSASVDGVRVLCRTHNQYEAERLLGRESVLAARAARQIDDDLIAGLRRMGVMTSDARQAVAATRGPGTVEQRMRAALGALHAIYASRRVGTRCEEPRRSYASGRGRLAGGADHRAGPSGRWCRRDWRGRRCFRRSGGGGRMARRAWSPPRPARPAGTITQSATSSRHGPWLARAMRASLSRARRTELTIYRRSPCAALQLPDDSPGARPLVRP